MSIRARMLVNGLTAMLILNALSIAAGFIMFWYAASPFAGQRLAENTGQIAAGYFTLGSVTVAVLTAIGVLWISYLNSKRVDVPIKRMKQALKAISEGNLDYELEVMRQGEFAELFTGFEQMRVRLKNNIILRENAETQRSTMIASITHDLQTPITSIMGYSEGILDGVADTPEKILEYAAVIRKKALSLKNLAEDLSLLARLENDQLKLNTEDEDIGALLCEIAEEFAGGCPGTQLKTDLTPDVRARIDREKMARVFVNIFQNSAKYKKPQQEGPQLSVLLTRRGGSAMITVSDNGIGVRQSDLPRLFDQFYMADTSRNRQSGSGLGLSIARHIVALHEGSIWIRNNPDGGISVNITLPLSGGGGMLCRKS